MCIKLTELSFNMFTATVETDLSHEEVVMTPSFDFGSICNISTSGSLISTDINA